MLRAAIVLFIIVGTYLFFFDTSHTSNIFVNRYEQLRVIKYSVKSVYYIVSSQHSYANLNFSVN